MSITLDTHQGCEADAPVGAHPRLSDAAIERAKDVLKIRDIDGLAAALGFANRATLWRARNGKTPIRLADARRIANCIGMPLEQVFEDGNADA